MVTQKYRDLIERFPLVPIKSDAHLDKAHAVAQSLMLRKKSMASDEKEYLEVLLDEIEKYEKKHHALQTEEMPPHKLLQSFMKDHGLKQVDMQTILGTSSGVMSELVSGKRELSKEHCVKLGQYFKVTPAAFLPKIFA
ncbi:MAG: helix-turn-helix domain-containing protein [Candidatus Melainabacteria bacterium]|nr:MAG: helix-turn-helix domain-containing protein [Candidatus Melainabacteria bacterium]